MDIVKNVEMPPRLFVDQMEHLILRFIMKNRLQMVVKILLKTRLLFVQIAIVTCIIPNKSPCFPRFVPCSTTKMTLMVLFDWNVTIVQ